MNHKMSAIKLIEGFHALQQLGQKKLPPFPVAYRVGEAIQKLESTVKDIERKRRALVKEYGVLSEDKIKIEVQADRMEEFTVKTEALQISEVEVDVPKISIMLFIEPIEPAILSPLLGWFIVEVEDAVAGQ